MRLATTFAALLISSTSSFALSMDEINSADVMAGNEAAAIKLDVLLTRAHSSPGVIDGVVDEPTKRAVAAFAQMNQNGEGSGSSDDDSSNQKDSGFQPGDSADLTEEIADALPSGDVIKEYEITDEDANIELTESIPETYAEMADMERVGYQSHAEALAEKFHMSQDLLEKMNPDLDFSSAGTTILVAATGERLDTDVASIEITTEGSHLYGYDDDDNLIFAAPAAVGSDEYPSPSGEAVVAAIAPMPNYTFKPGTLEGEAETAEAVIVPPGANGPVGSMWISLSKDGYGIHGTPYPSKINSMTSHGCVRLTNWDAETLGQNVLVDETDVVIN